MLPLLPLLVLLVAELDTISGSRVAVVCCVKGATRLDDRDNGRCTGLEPSIGTVVVNVLVGIEETTVTVQQK